MYFQNKYRIESTRLKDFDYSSNGYYFITICTKNRECIFREIINEKMQLSAIGEFVLNGWKESFDIRKELFCDEFVIMPNHIHGIVIIENQNETYNSNIIVETHGRASLPERASLKHPHRMSKSISSFVSGFKSAMTKYVNIFRHTPGMSLWQSRFYDHIIRDEKSLQKIRNYIVNNPINWQNDEMNPLNLSKKEFKMEL
jgi:putative transposase